MNSSVSKDTPGREDAVATAHPPAATGNHPDVVVLFGASSLCGEALLAQLPPQARLICPGRNRPPAAGIDRRIVWLPCDLADTRPAALERLAVELPDESQDWLSFAPIWLFAPFLAALADAHPQRLGRLRALVACSSSSVITKRFAANRFDLDLVVRLSGAQRQLEQLCAAHALPLCVLAPTLIHGRSAHFADRNVETLRLLMHRLPLLPLPYPSGLRQPIAASDLVQVALAQLHRLRTAKIPSDSLLAIGGDETLSYRQLLERIQAGDAAAARCRLLPLPARLVVFLASPLVLFAPKTFEAIWRMGADLAGFARPAELLGTPPQPFRPLPEP